MRNCQDRTSLLLEAPLLLCLLLPSPSPSPVSAVATFCLSCKEKARLSSALDLDLRADISHDTNFVSNDLFKQKKEAEKRDAKTKGTGLNEKGDLEEIQNKNSGEWEAVMGGLTWFTDR
ncbi:hypothetical protein IWZ03DRAFT_357401 [Phyllosticta citriasiana]|uniref:Uncharacterized protein n=1 Tax=Phyllosticta citriasiana TaxID=595635 RepID=A0ABR1KVX6_9PEZI